MINAKLLEIEYYFRERDRGEGGGGGVEGEESKTTLQWLVIMMIS